MAQKRSKEYDREHWRKWAKKTRLLALEKVSNGKLECVECGCDVIEFLEINHINGGGNKERKAMKYANWHFYSKLAKGEIRDDLILLCRVCNWFHGKKLNPNIGKYKIVYEKPIEV